MASILTHLNRAKSGRFIMSKDNAYKLGSLFAIALLLLNFPLIRIFSKDGLLFGIPILFLYIFVVWLLIIVITFLIQKASKKNK